MCEGEDVREQRARCHSARAGILAVLAKDERELTAVQIQAELPDDLGLRDISYHLRILGANRLIAKDGERYRLC
jgi:repressor of nif and glnA expression